VKILLGRDDVNPDKPYNDGRTPLWDAVFSGQERVVKVLLAHGDVTPDKPDIYGENATILGCQKWAQGSDNTTAAS